MNNKNHETPKSQKPIFDLDLKRMSWSNKFYHNFLKCQTKKDQASQLPD